MKRKITAVAAILAILLNLFAGCGSIQSTKKRARRRIIPTAGAVF